MDKSESLLTVREVAELLRMTVAATYMAVERRQIPHIRLGPRKLRFRKQDLEAWLEEHYEPPLRLPE
jgi:excisionase family DNA binding protein